jgi:hypothetical protein
MGRHLPGDFEEKTMNHQLWNRVGARVVAIAFTLGLAACGERLADTHAKAPSANPASPAGMLVGTAPAQPSGDPPGTTPVDPNTSDVTKQAETTQKPSEGDDHSHSSVARDNPQKSGGQDPQQQPDRK